MDQREAFHALNIKRHGDRTFNLFGDSRESPRVDGPGQSRDDPVLAPESIDEDEIAVRLQDSSDFGECTRPSGVDRTPIAGPPAMRVVVGF